MSLVTAGCVTADPPQYSASRQTPPFLDLSKADPSVFVLTELESGSQGTVSVPVRSEDAGDPLVAQLILNYTSAPQQLVTDPKIPPSTFDDTTRKIEMNYLVPDEKGCQELSLVVQHFSSYGSSETSDVAIATWVVGIDLDGTDLVDDCPRGGTP